MNGRLRSHIDYLSGPRLSGRCLPTRLRHHRGGAERRGRINKHRAPRARRNSGSEGASMTVSRQQANLLEITHVGDPLWPVLRIIRPKDANHSVGVGLSDRPVLSGRQNQYVQLLVTCQSVRMPLGNYVLRLSAGGWPSPCRATLAKPTGATSLSAHEATATSRALARRPCETAAALLVYIPIGYTWK